MRKFSWAYYDTLTDSLVLVKRPYKRAMNPKMIVRLFDSDGFACRQEFFELFASDFRKRFIYLGGINTKGRPGKRQYRGDDLGKFDAVR